MLAVRAAVRSGGLPGCIISRRAFGLGALGDNRPSGSGPRREKKVWPSKKKTKGRNERLTAAMAKGGKNRPGPAKKQGLARDQPPELPGCHDALAAGIEFIDDFDGTKILPLPKSQWIDPDTAVERFMKREESVPGPITIVYLPPDVGLKKMAAPRSVEELVAYSENLQYVNVDDSPPDVKRTVNQAWKVLCHSWHMPEPKKRAFMNDLKRTMEKIDGDMSFYKQFEVPPIGSIVESKETMAPTGFYGYGFNDWTRSRDAPSNDRHKNNKK